MAVRGFTYIEIMITVAIVAIMASVALPLAEISMQRIKEQDLARALREIRTAIDEYKRLTDEGQIAKTADSSGYPPSLEALARGVEDAKSPKSRKIYLLRRVPRDPMTDDPAMRAEQTWGKRSYKSPPERPEEGDDVFDVYSRSEKVGLNGVPYREW